jgi:hypothetical protein
LFVGLSVAVDIFTLVCISIERYLAICRPLFILKLQSIRFSNLLNICILFLIWSLGLLIALPNLFMHNLCSLPKPGRFKCEKIATNEFDERIYMVALDGNIFQTKFQSKKRIFFFSFLFCDTNGCHDCSIYINNMENVSKQYSNENEIISK